MNALATLWSWVVWLLRVLWACRVSTVSVAVGLWGFGKLVQAQNLLADTSWNTSMPMAIAYWTLFFAAVFVIWAFPVHFGARRTLSDPTWILSPHVRAEMGEKTAWAFCDDAAERHHILILWMPRLLGLLPFVAIAFGLWQAMDAVAGAQTLTEGADAERLIHTLLIADGVTALAFLAFILLRQRIVRALKTVFEIDRHGDRRIGRGEDVMGWLRVACLLITLLLFIVAYFAPVALAAWVPRAALVPFLLGSLVLPLAWLADRGHRTGTPLLLLVIVACVLVTAANRHFNDLRAFEVDAAQRAGRQMDVDLAVERWKAANGCAGSVDGAGCPPALIVSAEGGASRAAFMAATAVGALLDRQGELGADTADDSPARRIFAISGVSGGALGAATIRAALADAETAQTARHAPPCRFAPRAWFRAPAAFEQPGFVASSWRYCLQALTSGDYLSPAIIGLAFRDNLAPARNLVGGPSLVDDRAVLLEQAFERHYDYVTASGDGPFATGSICGPSSTPTGLCRRFGYAAALETGTAWVPLLLLNGTSVQTGRRVIVSDLASTRADRDERVALYPEAYDLFEATSTPHPLCAGPACPTSSDVDGPDVLLSTAALASARFPIISPAGSYHPRGDEAKGDRVVDGGYFENAGLTTARDVARVLLDNHVKPLILWVGNDPQTISTDVVPPRPGTTPTIGIAQDADVLVRAFGLLGAPFDALIATRQGHGVEAARLAAEIARLPTDPARSGLFRIGVFDKADLAPDPNPDPADLKRCDDLKGRALQMTEVSMSWWLSPAVQADLDAQLCDARNRRVLAALVSALRTKAATSP